MCRGLKAQLRNCEAGIIAIDVADAQPKCGIAAKHLQGIEKIIEAMGRDIVIGKRHKGDFAPIHQFGKMDMRNR